MWSTRWYTIPNGLCECIPRYNKYNPQIQIVLFFLIYFLTFSCWIQRSVFWWFCFACTILHPLWTRWIVFSLVILFVAIALIAYLKIFWRSLRPLPAYILLHWVINGRTETVRWSLWGILWLQRYVTSSNNGGLHSGKTIYGLHMATTRNYGCFSRLPIWAQRYFT